MFFLFLNINLCVCFEVITQERTIHNIEVFDKTKLKHAETAEKVVLPDEQGRFICVPKIVKFMIMDISLICVSNCVAGICFFYFQCYHYHFLATDTVLF